MFTAVVLLDVLCLWPLSRLIYDMMKRGIVVGLAFMLAGVVIWRFEDHLSKQSNPDPLDRRDIILIGTAIITGCYLFSTIGFALTIYPFVPAERGGGNYFHSPNIALDLGDASGFPEDLLQPREVSEKAVEPVSVRVYEPSQLQGFVQNRTAKSQVRRSLPLKLLEQTSAWIYVAPPKGADSFADWHPRIIAVKATAVSEIENLDSDCKTDCER